MEIFLLSIYFFIAPIHKKASQKGGTAVFLFCMSYGGLVLFGDKGKG